MPLDLAAIDSPQDDILLSFGRLFVRAQHDGRWYLVDDGWDTD